VAQVRRHQGEVDGSDCGGKLSHPPLGAGVC
jgi:hypothetical protein